MTAWTPSWSGRNLQVTPVQDVDSCLGSRESSPRSWSLRSAYEASRLRLGASVRHLSLRPDVPANQVPGHIVHHLTGDDHTELPRHGCCGPGDFFERIEFGPTELIETAIEDFRETQETLQCASKEAGDPSRPKPGHTRISAANPYSKPESKNGDPRPS